MCVYYYLVSSSNKNLKKSKKNSFSDVSAVSMFVQSKKKNSLKKKRTGKESI